MKSLITAFNHKTFLAAGAAWGWFEIVAVPKPMLLVLLFGAIIIDLLTGLIKSWNLGKATSSTGFRKTVTKVGAYVGVILGVWFLSNIMNGMYETAFDYAVFVNACIGFLTFIEIYSIFENVYEIDPNSLLSKKFIKPILKFLKGKLDNNPISKLTKDESDESDK